MHTTSTLYKELSQDELNEIIAKNFGNGTPYIHNLLSGGLFNTTYMVTLFPNRNNEQRIVLRVGPVNRHLLLPFEQNLMTAEQKVYELYEANDICGSKLIACDVSKTITDRNYMIIEYIKSTPLSDLKITSEQNSRICHQIGVLCEKMHNITEQSFGRVYEVTHGMGFSKWGDYIKSELSQWRERVIEFYVYTSTEINIIDNVFNKYYDLLNEIETPHLVHADLWEGNVLIRDDNGEYNVAAIIDDDPKCVIRRKIYLAIYHLIDSYVWTVQYNNPNCSKDNKDAAMKLMHELL